MQYTIYKLINPIDESIFYVGCTQQSLQKRLAGHLQGAKRKSGCNKHMDEYITKIVQAGKEPIITEIVKTNDRNKEHHYIGKLSKTNKLLNASEIKVRNARAFEKKYKLQKEKQEIKKVSALLQMDKNLCIDKIVSSCHSSCKGKNRMEIYYSIYQYEFYRKSFLDRLGKLHPSLAVLVSEIKLEFSNHYIEYKESVKIKEEIKKYIYLKYTDINILRSIHTLLTTK